MNLENLKQLEGNKVTRLRATAFAIGILVSVLSVQLSFADDEAAPWQTIPSGLEVPTNAVVYPSPTQPPSPGGGQPPSSINPAVDFTGLNDDNTRIPPDTMGAVGPNHVVTMLNTQVRITDRTGTNIYSTVSLSNFWGSVGGLHFPFDPRIVYVRTISGGLRLLAPTHRRIMRTRLPCSSVFLRATTQPGRGTGSKLMWTPTMACGRTIRASASIRIG